MKHREAERKRERRAMWRGVDEQVIYHKRLFCVQTLWGHDTADLYVLALAFSLAARFPWQVVESQRAHSGKVCRWAAASLAWVL